MFNKTIHKLLHIKKLWVTLILLIICGYYVNLFFKAKLIVENDATTTLEFTVSYLGISKKETFSLRSGAIKTVYFSENLIPKGKLLICAENDRCKYVNYLCRGFGGCFSFERKKHIKYSKFNNNAG